MGEGAAVWKQRVVILVCMLAVSWIGIGMLGYGYFQNASKVILRNYTGVGLPKHDVVWKIGEPDAVLTEAADFDRPPFSRYERSQRPMTPQVMVYFRFGRMVAVYLGEDDCVVGSFWGQKRG